MTLGRVVRDSFIAGLAVIAPLLITVLAFQFMVNWVTKFLDPFVQETRLVTYTANIEIVAQILAVVIIVVVITLLGYIAQRSFGERLFGWIDRGIGLVPLVRIVYTSVRQVADALMDRSSRYESAVLVEYPRKGIYAIGFITGDSPTKVQTVAGENAYNVFIPNSPNPTGGRLAMVPADQVHEVDISVRRSVRLLVTTGIAEEQDELEALREDASPKRES